MDSSKNKSSGKAKGKKARKAKPKEHFTYLELKAKYEKLQKESSDLDKRIAELEAQGINTDLQPQMQALHEYNETKDTAQMVLGYLADAEHVTIAELHKRYNLPLE